jgi:hypothetical protein
MHVCGQILILAPCPAQNLFQPLKEPVDPHTKKPDCMHEAKGFGSLAAPRELEPVKNRERAMANTLNSAAERLECRQLARRPGPARCIKRRVEARG